MKLVSLPVKKETDLPTVRNITRAHYETMSSVFNHSFAQSLVVAEIAIPRR